MFYNQYLNTHFDALSSKTILCVLQGKGACMGL